jgi:hypothetical protein
LDILHAFARCLNVNDGDADSAQFQRCLKIDKDRRAWLREHLRPRVLMIRNGTDPVEAGKNVCFDVAKPKADDVKPRPLAASQPASGCDQLSAAGHYQPQRPICRPRSSLFVDLLGPPLTVLHVSGIGSNGQLAEARESHAVQALRMRGAASAPGVTAIDLLPDGVRYPLGWHLSPAAVDGMLRQISTCSVSAAASAPSQAASASLTQTRNAPTASNPSRSNAASASTS